MKSRNWHEFFRLANYAVKMSTFFDARSLPDSPQFERRFGVGEDWGAQETDMSDLLQATSQQATEL
jgi:hypothetical protein